MAWVTLAFAAAMVVSPPVIALYCVGCLVLKCLHTEQRTFFPATVGENSCITCQIHDLFACWPAFAGTTVTVNGVPLLLLLFSSH